MMKIDEENPPERDELSSIIASNGNVNKDCVNDSSSPAAVEDEPTTTRAGDDDNIINIAIIDDNNNNEEVIPEEKQQEENTVANNMTPPAPAKRNINSYYGHKVGFLQTLSLTLNAGLMVYAHVGLSAAILSSRDPSITDVDSAAAATSVPTDTTAAAGVVEETNASGGKCNNEQDIQTWITHGGETTRPVKSNYCSREYNSIGCFLDAVCIEECFQMEHGYSEECSTCFSVVPTCSVTGGCLEYCAVDSLGEKCQECNINAGCIEELANCTGLPPIDDEAQQQQQPAVSEGKCNNEQDKQTWITHGGEATRPEHSNYCSREYNNGCLLDAACIEMCFQEEYGYSAECTSCFGVVPTCSVISGCTEFCAVDSFSPDCQECNIPCIEELGVCTGLQEVDVNATLPPNNNETTDDGTVAQPLLACNNYDLEAIDTWYNVYDLTFIRSIKDAWNGDAKLLAVIIVLFSGIWPYLKNIMLVMIWYIPATEKTQSSTLLWLSRLSKYTLVDVFAVIGVLVGVQLQLNVGGTEAVTRAEPRFGIIAFFLATVWEFLQIELIKAMYERKLLSGNRDEAGEERLLFSKLWFPVVILVASIGLYILGATTELVYFASSDDGGVSFCKKSYNLVTLGNALVNELSMTSNSTPGQTWILYLSYVILNLAFPVLTHLLQFGFIVGWFKSKKLKRLIEWTLAIWCFACIEVLLIGIFAVEYKFPNLVMKIAGETNSTFLTIDSQLGVGFYILIAYAFVAGFMQACLRIRREKSKPCCVFMCGWEGA